LFLSRSTAPVKEHGNALLSELSNGRGCFCYFLMKKKKKEEEKMRQGEERLLLGWLVL
jgi:hypothetical protein